MEMMELQNLRISNSKTICSGNWKQGFEKHREKMIRLVIGGCGDGNSPVLSRVCQSSVTREPLQICKQRQYRRSLI